MLHKMKLQEDPFERIKNGTKTVEFRLYDEKRQTIQIGDEIEFSKLPELQEKLLVKVIDLYKEKSFEKLFKKVFVGEDEEKIINRINELLEKIIVNNFGSNEFFINKAIGWSLRDYSKTNPKWVKEFVGKYKDKMDKLSIKEASKYI